MKYKEYLKYKDIIEKEYKESFEYFKKNGKSPHTYKWWIEEDYRREGHRLYRFLRKGFEFVENYKSNDIYKKDGRFVPYAHCHYYFKSLEDCKKRIDMTNISMGWD